jgi:two-component system, NtrC family, sensor kinase
MNSRPDPASQWQTVFDRIDATMHVDPEQALTLCKQVFVESYLWEPAVYVRAAERYGKIMDHLGKSTEARDSLLAAQQAAQGSCLPIYEAKILERLARGYYTGGDYRRAMQYWGSCIEVINQTGGDAETWILAKVGLAQVYKGTGDYAAGLAMLAEAQARTVEENDPHLDAKVKINQAVVLIELERPAEASAILHEAFKICSEHQLFDYLAESNLYLGKIALADGALERALAYLEAGLAAARQVNFRWCEAHILAVKAKVFSRSGDIEMALRTVKEAQAIATADGFSDMLIQQHFAAAEYAASLNDFATAFVEYKAGHECERRLYVRAPLERSVNLKEEAGSHQSLNRLLLDLSNHGAID